MYGRAGFAYRFIEKSQPALPEAGLFWSDPKFRPSRRPADLGPVLFSSSRFEAVVVGRVAFKVGRVGLWGVPRRWSWRSRERPATREPLGSRWRMMAQLSRGTSWGLAALDDRALR